MKLPIELIYEIYNFSDVITKVKINKICNMKKEFDWIEICEKYKLSEEFIREFSEEVYWDYISVFQPLSDELIREFSEKVNWYCIIGNQNMSASALELLIKDFPKCYISYYGKSPPRLNLL